MGSLCRKYVSTSSHHSFISFYYAPQLLIYLHLGYLLPLQFFYSLGDFVENFYIFFFQSLEVNNFVSIKIITAKVAIVIRIFRGFDNPFFTGVTFFLTIGNGSEYSLLVVKTKP